MTDAVRRSHVWTASELHGAHVGHLIAAIYAVDGYPPGVPGVLRREEGNMKAMKRYRPTLDHSHLAAQQQMGMQGAPQWSQQLAAINNQGPTVRFVEDENGAWVPWREAQLAIQELEAKLMACLAERSAT
jgi:hypothetical protein